MSSRTKVWLARTMIAFIWVGAMSLALVFGHGGYLGILAVLPLLGLLAWDSPVAFYFLGGVGLFTSGVGLGIAAGLSEAEGSVAGAFWAVLANGMVMAVCQRFLAVREREGHARRQWIEELQDEAGSLAEKIVEQESALTRLENRRKRYSRLQEAAAQLATTLELEELAVMVLSQAEQILAEKRAGIILFVFDANGKEILRSQTDSGAGTHFTDDRVASEDPLNQWVLARGTTLIIRDLEKDFRFRGLDMSASKSVGFYISPLTSTQGAVTGLLRVETLEREGVDTEDQRLLESLSVLASLAFENAKLYRETQELAVTDGLTKLLLRRPLLERMDEEFKRSSQSQSPLSFILLDIDHFKAVNDTYGHPAGDRVLREIAARVRKRVRDVDVCGRYGGEEFGILLPATDLKGARLVAERIREGVKALPFELRGETRVVTVSLGVACYPDDASEPEALIQKADEALYRSKSSGRDRVTAISDPA